MAEKSQGNLRGDRSLRITLAVSILFNIVGATTVFAISLTPYFDLQLFHHARDRACGVNRSYHLSHDSAAAREFFEVSICGERIRANSDGSFSIDPN